MKKSHKLCSKWIAPPRITKIVSDLVYEVTTLVDNKTLRVHAIRIMLYRNYLENTKVSEELVRHATHAEATYDDIRLMRDIKKHGRGFHVCVEWNGLPDQIYYTWESISTFNKDVPDMLKEFL